MNMSPASFVCLVLFATQAAVNGLKTEEDTAQQYAQIMQKLTSVNHTVNKLYELMSTQKDRDIDSVESKIKDSYDQIRNRRDAPAENSEGLDKIQDALKNFQTGFQSFMKNVTSSDLYKQVQKIGEDLQAKGKELGSKIEDTIKNARKDSAEKN